MTEYNAEYFDPPAPVAHVIIRNPATGASLHDILMLIDTGADATALPQTYVEQLGVEPDKDKVYLNNLRLFLDGPREIWEEQKR